MYANDVDTWKILFDINFSIRWGGKEWKADENQCELIEKRETFYTQETKFMLIAYDWLYITASLNWIIEIKIKEKLNKRKNLQTVNMNMAFL